MTKIKYIALDQIHYGYKNYDDLISRMVNRRESFEDGMYSILSLCLLEALDRYGIEIVRALDRYMDTAGKYSEGAAEALKWLAYSDDDASYEERKRVLCKHLSNPDHYEYRDAAIRGIGHLYDDPDPQLVHALLSAAAVEVSDELREDMLSLVHGFLEDYKAERNTILWGVYYSDNYNAIYPIYPWP